MCDKYKELHGTVILCISTLLLFRLSDVKGIEYNFLA